jgi:EAL domain-containing protein (putative c-di-GMP-specific phosphodiesterase class I)
MIAEIGESFELDPGDLQVAETSVDFQGQSLSDSDVESILGHVLERFKAEGAGGVSAGSAEAFLRKMTAETVSRVVMMRDLIHERRLSLHYQPIVALTDRKTHHYEVLLRFPDGRSPFEDILFAEQINTIHEVDLAVTQGAIARLQEADEKHQELSLAVNMSARSLLNNTFLSMFETLADKVGGGREKLIIEITESAKLEDLAKAARAVARLNARGHPVCLDDFGAGASSLPYLQRLIVGYVKIDGAYVRGIHDRLRERAIIEGVLATCRSLGVLTVAEMVEHEEEHKILQDLGVTLGQGWLYGRPAPQIAPSGAQARVPRKMDPAAVGRLLVKNNP